MSVVGLRVNGALDDIQSKLDPFSCIVVHGPKKAPNSLTLKGYNIRRKNPGLKLFRQSN